MEIHKRKKKLEDINGKRGRSEIDEERERRRQREGDSEI